MARYGMLIDADKCNGCHSCFIACKDEHIGNPYPPYTREQGEMQRWLDVKTIERGSGSRVRADSYPLPCLHCETPACMSKADGAVYKRADGIVIIDPGKAAGKQELISACPFGRIFWNEELKLPQKCTLCAHMLDAGELTTRCAECCPTGAIVFGNLDDPESEISRLIAVNKRETPDGGSSAAVVGYINLPKRFLTGELVCSVSGECIAGGIITLTCRKTGQTLETSADFLGDFGLEGLAEDTAFEMNIHADGYEPVKLSIPDEKCGDLGTITLSPKPC